MGQPCVVAVMWEAFAMQLLHTNEEGTELTNIIATSIYDLSHSSASDLTGQFPVTSSKGKKNLLILHHIASYISDIHEMMDNHGECWLLRWDQGQKKTSNLKFNFLFVKNNKVLVRKVVPVWWLATRTTVHFSTRILDYKPK